MKNQTSPLNSSNSPTSKTKQRSKTKMSNQAKKHSLGTLVEETSTNELSTDVTAKAKDKAMASAKALAKVKSDATTDVKAKVGKQRAPKTSASSVVPADNNENVKPKTMGSARLSFNDLNLNLFAATKEHQASPNNAVQANNAVKEDALAQVDKAVQYDHLDHKTSENPPAASVIKHLESDEQQISNLESSENVDAAGNDPALHRIEEITSSNIDDSLLIHDPVTPEEIEARGEVETFAQSKDAIRVNEFIDEVIDEDLDGNSLILQPHHLNEVEETSNLPYYKKKLQSILKIDPPRDRLELCTRLNMLVGYSIAELAALAHLPLPEQSSSGKGFVGQLIEIFLGANASNLPLPDFVNLNIELKTIPLGTDMMPQESTFLCVADLNREGFVSFEKSQLYHKLKTILFVLVLAPKNSQIAKRRILGYFFFSPHGKTLETMREDYNELIGLINEGRTQEINASMGTIIHMRPKAANAQELTSVRDQDGNIIQTRPRGYYLRRAFTKELMEHFMKEQGITKDDLAVLSTLI